MKAKKIKAITIAILLMIPALGFGQIAPDLKSAADFAILAATEIAFNGPATTINTLDIGLYPGTSISGNYILNGGVALTATTDPAGRLVPAKQDLLEAYLFAANATVPAPATISDDQGGETLEPGIYKSTSTLAINGTALRLDAQGNENAVWIFQIASGLTTTAGGDVELINGAKANNVYWQVGSSATIGSGTDFVGNILALESISIDTGASIEGRALALNGAVTFAGDGTMEKPGEESEPAPAGALTITKTATPLTFLALGDLIGYEIKVTNNGGVTLSNITVEDELTELYELISLDPGLSATFTTSYNITEIDLQNGFVFNIATAKTSDLSEYASAYVTVLQVVPPPSIPLSAWALALGGLLIAGFVFFQYRRSTPARV